MTDIRKHISTLTMPEKVELFNDLYGELSGYGTEGDTELAHVNTFEVGLLKSVGGSGTINEITGLRQFGPGGGSPPPPTQQVKQEASFPAELRPFVKDVLTQGQAEFERQQEEGFQAFPGPQISDFGPEQLAAQELGRRQFTGLAGTGLADPRTYYQPALSATALGTAEIGTGDIARRMDPFLQNVVDVAKREARRDEDIAAQGRSAQAAAAGSFGGSRQAILEAEAERNLGQRLGDIQAQGLSQSFQNAQLAAEQQRAREMTGGRQFAALGDITGARARSDLSGLTGIGDVRQQREQQALDIARREFLDEQAFPQRTLQDYSSLIRGFPLDANQQRTTTETLATPSLAQTLIGGLGTAAGIYGGFGGFSSSKEGGLVGLQGGGQPMMGPQMQQQPNEMDALEMLRQRGAAIRGLSKPIDTINRFGGGLGKRSGVAAPQPTGAVTRPDGLIMRNILKNNPELLEKLKGLGGGGQKAYTEFNPGTSGSQYASGGVVNKSIGSILRQYPGGAKSMDLAGDVRSAVRDKDSKGLLQMMLRKNPKLLKKLGVASGGGKKAYAEFNPGTAGSQYAEGGIVSLASGSTMYGAEGQGQRRRGEDPEGEEERGPITYAELARLRDELEGMPVVGDPELAKLLKERRLKELGYYDERSERIAERLEGLDDRQFREQMFNLAGMFGQFGSTTSAAAQQPGVRGLLGAFTEAGSEAMPAFSSTSDKYYGRKMDLEDLASDVGAQKLQAETGITEAEYQRSLEEATAKRAGAAQTLESGIDLAVARSDDIANNLKDNYKTGDVNAAYRAVASLMPNAVIQEVAGEMMFDSKAMGTKAAFEASNIIADYMSALTFAESQGMTTVQGHDYAKEKIMPRLRAIAIKDTTNDSLPTPKDSDINDLRQAIKDQGIDAPELDPAGNPTGVSVLLSFATNFGMTMEDVIELATGK
jgi:hypothetical protein